MLDNWLIWNFKAQATNSGDYKFPCPKCHHPNFYFNPKKRVGFCHRASCHWTPGLTALCLVAGIPEPHITSLGPMLSRVTPLPEKQEESYPQFPLHNTHPLVTLEKDGTFTTCDGPSVSWLHKRGITTKQIYHHNIHVNAGRIYVPVYERGKLRQYVSRVKPWFNNKIEPKYIYASGTKIGRYLFNWEKIRQNNTITLVENTFNAIWLQDYINTTSIFGSNLSWEQEDHIIKSKVKRILFMFDEDMGHSYKNVNAVAQLRKKGKDVRWLHILQEPESYSVEFLKSIYDAALVYPELYFDVRDVCNEYLKDKDQSCTDAGEE